MAIVKMPDGRLAHFADDVSPEELRRYIISDVPDAVADPGTIPSAEQIPLDLAVPNLPSARGLPGEINHLGPGMPIRRPGEPEWDFHPFPDGDDGGAFRREILSLLAEQEFNRAQLPKRDPAEPVTPPAGDDEPGGGFPFADILEPVGRGFEDARTVLFGKRVGDKYQMPNLGIDSIGYDGRIIERPSSAPLIDPFSVYANETLGTLPGFGPSIRDWLEAGDASLASWMEGKPVTAEEREAINAAAVKDFPEAALRGKVTGELILPLLLGRYFGK